MGAGSAAAGIAFAIKGLEELFLAGRTYPAGKVEPLALTRLRLRADWLFRGALVLGVLAMCLSLAARLTH